MSADTPAHAEAVEASEGCAEPGESVPPPSTPAQHWLAAYNACASQEWQDGFNAALAARPAAVGGEVPELPEAGRYYDLSDVPCRAYTEGQMREYARAAIAATQPQQLAVTDEAVEAAKEAYACADFVWCDAMFKPGDSRHTFAMRAALTAALPHLVRKENARG